eukprot:CAMPEP_0201535156 /NCGR_PEP_ID=MMETSP0161_2-20130828/58230_1 /ASSEMBLY_ACC=CAM_ASM_000251 /TAXON_ID=180227 /ORGANISM="Neoparamoeba aestuarina, Strain SoJaBio B1-5/56/2" /LENGTH=57 /DNA_ID=CAMNT_0047940161 /DNA_START=84 /DNA_END=254 /DNA_ORIENTATION=+
MLKGFRRGRDRPLSHQIPNNNQKPEEIEDKIRSAVDYWMGEQPEAQENGGEKKAPKK